MKIIRKIKETIFKIKDYDRLESDYSQMLDYATGGILSKTGYELNTVHTAIAEHWKEIEKEMERPAKRVENILNTLGKDSTWMVLSLYSNGRSVHFFRDGYKISEDELTEHDKEWLYSWCHAMLYNYEMEHKRKIQKEKGQ